MPGSGGGRQTPSRPHSDVSNSEQMAVFMGALTLIVADPGCLARVLISGAPGRIDWLVLKMHPSVGIVGRILRAPTVVGGCVPVNRTLQPVDSLFFESSQLAVRVTLGHRSPS